jgi:Fe-S cluster assembly protein SufD
MSTVTEPQPETPSSTDPLKLEPDFNRLNETPQWFQQRVRHAWEVYLATPVPAAKTETWRYSNARRIQLDVLSPAEEGSAEDQQRAISLSQGISKLGAKLVFLNDRLIYSSAEALALGVQCLPFAEALRTHGDVLEQYLMKRESELGSTKFAALHLAHVKAGAVILVPKNTVQELPIEIYHWVAGENAVTFPHTLIVAGEQSRVTVVDHHGSLNEEHAQSIAVADLVAGPSSRIQYVNVQEMAVSANALHISSTSVGKDAEVQALQLQLGAAFTRSESVSDLLGENSRSEMFGVSLPVNDQVVDMRTLQNHVAAHSFSDLLYKNSLADNSRTIFSGLIQVAEGAHYTDAYQKCRNLLNSEECEAVSMPGLEINADQVKCSHGATSAPISADELFYLKARGIADRESRRLIELGFLEDVISRLGNEALIEDLDRRIEAKHG